MKTASQNTMFYVLKLSNIKEKIKCIWAWISNVSNKLYRELASLWSEFERCESTCFISGRRDAAWVLSVDRAHASRKRTLDDVALVTGALLFTCTKRTKCCFISEHPRIYACAIKHIRNIDVSMKIIFIH